MTTPHDDLVRIDFTNLWHPFTQSSVWFEGDPLIVERAEGVELIDTKGRRYLDGVSSLWCNVHGHAVPELVEAIKAQADLLCHSTLLGLSHRAVLELTATLMEVAPSGLTRAFYADSGSTAVEAALRMCIEWWQKEPSAAGRTKRRLLSLDTAYHGDTLGAVAVGFVQAFHAPLQSQIVPALRVPPPHLFRFYEAASETEAVERALSALDAVLSIHGHETAAMIIEPLVQGAAGIWTHPVEYLRGAVELCRKHDVLVVVDEVATGFGKTGTMFACEQAGVSPDVMVVGKGLSGGYLPISAALATERIFDGFTGAPEELKTFYYGQTFAGNPLAAAVSAASLDLFRSSRLLETLPQKISVFQRALTERVAPLAHVDEIRMQGVMVGIELTAEPGKRVPYPMGALAGARITQEARRRGVIIRPLGNVMVLMPPLAMSEEQLVRLVQVTAESIEAALGS